MNFLFPGYLFALSLISIPIIIHLFHFRRFKKLYFSNTAFVKLIKNERRTKSNLKNLIILILRILTIASLVIAFAQPYIPHKGTNIKSGKKSVSIYIDNSLSMENNSTNGSLLEDAKILAEMIIQSYEESDEFQIITNELSAFQDRFYSKQQAIEILSDVKSSSSKKLSVIYNRQRANLLRNTSSVNKISYLISDFQKSTSDLDNLTNDTSIVTYLLPLKPLKENNVYIDSAWFDKPIMQYRQPIVLNVKIWNKSEKEIEDASVYFKLNGKQKGISNFSLEAGQSKTIPISFTLSDAGWNKGLLEIEDYPLSFDDRYYLSFNVQEYTSILEIYKDKPNRYLKSVFNTDEFFIHDKIPISNLRVNTLNEYQLIILNELSNISTGVLTELTNFINRGGNLLLIPPSGKNASLNSYNKLLSDLGLNEFSAPVSSKIKVESVNSEHDFFSGIFENQKSRYTLPQNEQYFPRNKTKPSTEIPLMKFDNSSPFLSFSAIGNGNIFILHTSLNDEWTNFMKHSFFLITMYKMALFNSDYTPVSFDINASEMISLKIDAKNNELFKLKNEDMEFIPDQDMFGNILNITIDENFDRPGYYELLGENNKKELAVLALNHSRIESDVSTYSNEEVQTKLGTNNFILLDNLHNSTNSSIGTETKGKALWKLFLISALALLFIEIIVIRLWK